MRLRTLDRQPVLLPLLDKCLSTMWKHLTMTSTEIKREEARKTVADRNAQYAPYKIEI